MEKSNRAKRFSTEVRARAVRMIFEHEHEYANQSAAIMAIAPKIGCFRDTLRRWVKQSDIDNGRKDGQTCDERAHIKAMEREIRELRQANEILRKASAYFAPTLTHASMCCRAAGRSSPAPSNDDCLHPLPGSRYAVSMRGEDHRDGLGVEPVCKVLPIAQSIARQAMLASLRGDILCACSDPQKP
jgi:transposase